MVRGVFITFEGGDGTGKSTQCANLARYFEQRGREVLRLREPGSTSIGEKVRDILLDIENSEMSAVAELLLYEAARAQMVAEVVKPALDRGAVVICDRFYDSTVAYQAYGRGLGRETVDFLNVIACQGAQIDRTILLERDTAEGLAFAKEKGVDRMEAESLEFHQIVSDAFETIAGENPERVRRVFMQDDPEATFGMILEEISDLL